MDASNVKPVSELESEVVATANKKETSSTTTSTTTTSTTISPPTTLTSSEVITRISVEPPTSASSTSVTFSTDSTTDSLKLVENSETDILMTTVPSRLSQSTTISSILPSRSTIAAVSQPRPFGFTRRRTNLSDSSTTTTPTPSNQLRPKVSITSRNSTRSSSPFLGRVRLRSRPVSDRVSEGDSTDPVHNTEAYTSRSTEISRSRVRNSNRGNSRYTPPTYRSRTEDVSLNSFQSRNRTSASDIDGSIRRRYRRPGGRTSNNTEFTKANELDDSPIIRIRQANLRRNTLSRSRSENSDEERITNIRVFKRPTNVNRDRDLYSGTKYTKNDDEFEESVEKSDIDVDSRQSNQVPLSSLEVSEVNNITEIDKFRKSDFIINVIDINHDVTSFRPRPHERLKDSIVESNTIDPTYFAISETGSEITTSTNKIAYTNDRQDDTFATTATHIETYDFNPDLVKMVSTERNVDSTDGLPKRRKVLLRRRPVSSTRATIQTNQYEDEEKAQLFRKRKVIRRLRPVQNTPSSALVEEEEEQEPLLKSTSPMRSQEDIEDSTIVTSQTGNSMEMKESTRAITETSLSINDDFDRFTKFTLETPAAETTTVFNEEPLDFLTTTRASIINTDVDEDYDSTEIITTEPISATATTERNVFREETLIPFTVPDNLFITRDQLSTIWSTSESDSSSTIKSNFESRYTQGKFIHKNPVSESAENTTSEYPPLSITEIVNPEILSKRKNSLFIRRYPISSTTANVLDDYYDDLSNEEEKTEDDLRDFTEQEVSEDINLRNNRGRTILPKEFSRDDSTDLSRYYTTISSTAQRNNPLDNVENIKENKTIHKSEIRPRYKVPVVVSKRPFDPEEALSPKRPRPLDSTFDEIKETPETDEDRFKQPGSRESQTRYKIEEHDNANENEADTTLSNLDSTTWQYRTRFYPKRPSTSTEASVTETLIPAKKFDYAADAVHRKQQSLKTTSKNIDHLNSQNFIESDISTAKPLVTRLVTSVVESGTTERQRIRIKTKYSSLTSTTKIPAEYFSTAPSPVTRDSLSDDESINEIRQGIERSTLPIESEFSSRRGRFTTESHESSTIEIESVFNNLITGKESTK